MSGPHLHNFDVATKLDHQRTLAKLVAMQNLLFGALTSALVGIGLWAALPRGVVLTKRFPATSWNGQILPDTWSLQNASALPVRLTSVRYRSPSTYNDATGRIEPREVPTEEGSTGPVQLTLDDGIAEITRHEQRLQWRQVVIPPGDTLTAHVSNNTDLEIKYRRDGLLGQLERRKLTLKGLP